MNQNSVNVSVPLREKNEEKFLQPYVHFAQSAQKENSLMFIRVFRYWMEIPDHIMSEIEEVLTTLYNVYLIIDDIEDNSKLRRGIPAAHVIYGIPATFTAANYMLFMALRKCQDLLSLRKDYKLRVELLCLDSCVGQGMDIYWRENFICPTEEEYCHMVFKKTSPYVGFVIGLMQACSENKHDFAKLTDLLGLYIQIRNDYWNLYSQDYQKRKSFCDDITEGKFSFPIIHAIISQPNDKEVLEILKKRTTDVELKKRCISLLEKYGSFEYTRKKMNSLRDEIINEFLILGDNPHLTNLIYNEY